MMRKADFARTIASVASAALLLGAALTVAGCTQATTTTSPSSVTASTTGGTITETMTGTLPVAGSKFYAFSVATAGTVTATLVSVGGTDVPPTVVLTLGIGSPVGTSCSGGQTTVQVSGGGGLPTLVSASEQPGTYCVILTDPGNLYAPATFTVSIDHP